MNEIKLILAGYFILMAAIGFYSWFKIKNASDYFISGKRGSWWQVSGSLYATIIGGSAILGTIELSQKAGWAAIWFLASASLGLFALAIISKRVSRLGHYTLPEMIGMFYGKKAEKTATMLIPVAWTGVIAVQIIAGAKTLTGLQIMRYEQGAIACAVIFIAYTLLGGQMSILKTDFIQSLIIIAALITMFVLRLQHPVVHDLPPFNARNLFNDAFSPADLVFLLLTYSVTFVVGPDIYSRIFCAKSEKVARNSVILVAILVIPTAFILTFLGVAAVSGPDPVTGQTFILPGTSFLPPWALGLLAAAMLSAIMSSADTTLLTSSTIISELLTGNLDRKDAWKTTRVFVIVLGAISLGIALQVTSILSAMLLSLSLFSGAFILPVAAGVAGWRVNEKWAFAGMIIGGFTALAGKIIHDNLPGHYGLITVLAAFALNALFLFRPIKK